MSISMETAWISKRFIFTLALFALVSIWIPSGIARGAAPPEGTNQERTAEMSDEDVKKSPLTGRQEQSTRKMDVQRDVPGPAAALGTLLHALDRQSDSTHNGLKKIVGNLPEVLPDLYRVFIALSSSGPPLTALKIILWVLFFIGLGVAAERFTNRFLRKNNSHFSFGNVAELPLTEESSPIGDKFAAVLVSMLPSFFGVIVFFVTAYFSYFAFIWTESPVLKLLFLAVLITITIIRFIAILAEGILSPADQRFRILSLSCSVAGVSYRLLVWTWGYIVSVLMFALVLHQLGANKDTVRLVEISAATLLLAVTAGGVLVNRKRITASLLESPQEQTEPPSWIKRYFASIWHLLALLYLVTLWLLMIVGVADPNTPAKGALILSFFVLPIWMLADQLLQWLVKHTMISLKLYEESDGSGNLAETDNLPEPHQGNALYLQVKHYTRLALIIAMVLWVAGLWGYSIPFISGLSSILFDSLIIMALALLFWQFISSWIERKIKESMPEESMKRDDTDDEWAGTAAQGRAYTLLPIIRSFIASVLIIMVTLTILSSMGVDIGPLLAGAGVVGLAIGFGAQKIVSDIFSGIFYLIDDAFRVGEYLSSGAISGTVEKISLRNVMLRHHRGMLQIIPYSNLGTITNYMRGGIIEKISLDFAYDADIDKIRKIIKKVGEEMLNDPEFGKDFIRPIKSQGVREITNSVMTIRVKFTTKPGAQFVIRREAFKRITEALKARGIQYAHRKVIVDIPMPKTSDQDPGQLQKIAQAAGAAARELFDEEEKLKKMALEKADA